MVDDFECACREEFRSACEGLPFYGKHEGKQYCILHFPSEEKDGAHFLETLSRKYKDQNFDFSGVYFPRNTMHSAVLRAKENASSFREATFNEDVDFSEDTFNEEASFEGATFNGDVDFSGATFNAEASFSRATFCKEVSFSRATFCEKADFFHATFNAKAVFFGATFCKVANFSATFRKRAVFSAATFNKEVYFSRATFCDWADLSSATFSKEVYFYGATFCNEAGFSGATFNAKAGFSGATFCEKVHFSATFSGEANYSGATFSKEVYFSGATFCDWASFSEATFCKEAYYYSATFRERADFTKATFCKEEAFLEATFCDWADFSEATFRERADFTKATFRESAGFAGVTFSEEVHFTSATFCKRADFSEATFCKEANFTRATFDELANFLGTTFDGVVYYFDATFSRIADFNRATFRERVHFSRLETFDETTFGFRNVTMEKPEQVSFHTPYLRPSWFVDVDAQKFDFSEVEWFRLPGGDSLSLEAEILALIRRGIQPPESLRKLAKACRRLTNNAEENRDYPTANEFHYRAMDARRLDTSSGFYEILMKDEVRQGIKEGERPYITRFRDLRFRDLDAKALFDWDTWKRIRYRERFGLINGLYWALSGYGVRPLRASVALLIMSLAFALLYSWPYFGAPYTLQALEGWTYSYWGGPLDYLGYFLRTEMYSLGALARLNPEPKPTPGLFQTLVIIAGILGPLQIALFLLAVRRKVMR